MGPDESIDTHIAGSLSLKSRKNEKSGFSKKPDFPVRIRIRWYGNLRGVFLRSQGVRRSEKKIPENPVFPDPDPDFRISAYGVAMGAEMATCSQNFRSLSGIVPEIFGSLTIIIYWIIFQRRKDIFSAPISRYYFFHFCVGHL